jgi:transcriptional regulator with XRE-family HTH domain
MALNPNATVRHRRLATELHNLRKARGLDGGEAAELLDWSRSNLSKLETASRRPSIADVERCLDLYGCDEAVRLTLIKMTQNLAVRGWWINYRDVLDPSFLELEDEAREVRTYHRNVIPGLLQTDEVAFAIIKLSNIGESSETQMRRVAARAARRQRLVGPDAPVFHAVIEESVLLRPLGGRQIMQAQLRALLEIIERPHIQIQVMPLDAWQHPGHEGSFTIMGFGETANFDVVYVEGAVGNGAYLEDVAQLEVCRLNFASISKAALDGPSSQAFIEGLLAK